MNSLFSLVEMKALTICEDTLRPSLGTPQAKLERVYEASGIYMSLVRMARKAEQRLTHLEYTDNFPEDTRA